MRAENAPPVVNRTVMDGVHAIMQCKEHQDVGWLLGNFIGRSNYNFQSYGGFQDQRPYPGSLLTVEFREASGSVSPTWTATYARICVGIFKFARVASRERFWAVIVRLASAEKAAMDGLPNKYDIISALQDLGLWGPAAFLEERLRSDPLRFWYPTRAVYDNDIACARAMHPEQENDHASDEWSLPTVVGGEWPPAHPSF
ncbi:hypothetical protein B0H67DRAFT_563865 [Lasiosphaeris hirsuta]|uniref:Uncharacterized protein n=1 Tax=Lasiosphaeris hirsuta TaxID=260670 RepID=A0AA40BBC6_9PEZI|nr:hypothetical protein B0H67DRAFT_563865 [Lasiosphaeris hirsuta]